MPSKIAIASLVLILALVNWSIYEKETLLQQGKIVYIELAPVDPRSLMQGDYMALRFGIGDQVFRAYRAASKSASHRSWRDNVEGPGGYAVVNIDERNVASFKKLYNKHEPALATDEIIVRYRVCNKRVKFATNAFFFQEGHGKFYGSARFGQFRVSDEGELLLVAMYDKNLELLEPDG